MKYCVKCQTAFSDIFQICPKDGIPMIDVDSAGEQVEITQSNADMLEQPDSLLGGFVPEEYQTGEDKLDNVTFINEKATSIEMEESSKAGFNVKSVVGQMIDGKYTVKELLGKGGMGAVYRARHTFINNDVAIKIINPRLADSREMEERFLREARAAAMIDHPNAIKVTDFGHDGDMLYLVMEFVQGQNLSNLIRKEGLLSPTATANIMGQICAALDAAHASSIIHRDLKPDNIMLKQNNLGELVVKVLDFGLAKVVSSESHKLTSAGVVLGTLTYMSPEQCKGEDELDLRSDVYSLGIIAFEMLTGRLPFTASTPAGILSNHILKPAPRPTSLVPGIPDEVERVVLKALEKDPAARYNSAGEFAMELRNAASCEDIRLSEILDVNATILGVNATGADAAAQLETEKGVKSDLTQPFSRQTVRASVYGIDGRVEPSGRSVPPAEKIEFIDSGARARNTQNLQTGQTVVALSSRSRAPIYAVIVVFLMAVAAAATYFAVRSKERLPAPPGSQTAAAQYPGMALIEGGWLKMGSEEGRDYEKPVHEVYVDSFYIDSVEVTNEQFEKFVNATGYVTDAEEAANTLRSWRAYATPDRKNHPVVSVSWNDAVKYAEWAGKRLPTEAEWEYAARGGLLEKKYPWGDDSGNRRANFDRGRGTKIPPTEPADTYELNGYGLYNMAGNASEWCMDWYDQNYYSASPVRNPQGPSTGQSRVIRGGSWYTDFTQIRVVARISDAPEGYEYDRGFRCAKSK